MAVVLREEALLSQDLAVKEADGDNQMNREKPELGRIKN